MKQFKLKDIVTSVGKLYLKLERIEKLILDKDIVADRTNGELLTIEDAAKLLKLSVATVYTKVSKNEIPVSKQGKRLYFYRTELLDWIKSGRIKTVNEIQREVELNLSSTNSLK